MSVSKKQLKANRENAKKSTGPKTEIGKTVASRNSIKYGFHARDVIINSRFLTENPDEYAEIVRSLYDELEPDTVFQDQLVQHIAYCLWRRRRAVVAETSHINDRLDRIESTLLYRKIEERLANEGDDTDDNRDAARELENIKGMWSIPDHQASLKIMRYERRLNREMTEAYELFRQLKNAQKRRGKRKNNNKKQEKIANLGN